VSSLPFERSRRRDTKRSDNLKRLPIFVKAHPIEIHPPSGFSPGVGKTQRFFTFRAAAAGLHAIKGARFDMFGISTKEAVKFVNHAPMRLQRA